MIREHGDVAIVGAGFAGSVLALVLQRAGLGHAPRGLVREALRLLWEREGWPRSDMDASAWQRLTELTLGNVPAIDLPGGLRGRCRDNVVLIGPAS